MLATGVIQAFDQADRTITLDGSRTFYLVDGVDMTSYRTNDLVTITYAEPKDGGRVASAIAKGMPPPPNPNVLVQEPKATKVNTTNSLKGK